MNIHEGAPKLAQQDDQASALVAPNGRPARPASKICPKCGAGPQRRRPSAGFGAVVHPLCGDCGHEFTEERWNG